jgi:hypothetical protein
MNQHAEDTTHGFWLGHVPPSLMVGTGETFTVTRGKTRSGGQAYDPELEVLEDTFHLVLQSRSISRGGRLWVDQLSPDLINLPRPGSQVPG